jgi:hypothetical protein
MAIVYAQAFTAEGRTGARFLSSGKTEDPISVALIEAFPVSGTTFADVKKLCVCVDNDRGGCEMWG